MSPRMTRKEKQAHTRECLLHSAAKVFARRGVQAASVDEIAQDAGFTKGAVYANFESKEKLFLAMLEERFAGRLAQMTRMTARGEQLEDQAREGGTDFARYVSEDPEWQRLFFEFCAYAGRNDEFRAELVSRYRDLRAAMADLYRRRAEELDIEPPVPPEQIALMTFAMANGFALEKLLEPETVDDGLYGQMLSIFFAGLRAMHDAHQADTAAAGAGA